jgi:hypothetical protein
MMKTIMKDADFVRGFCECAKDGMTVSQTAEKMGLSASNISIRSKNLREKYGVALPELTKAAGKTKDTISLNALVEELMNGNATITLTPKKGTKTKVGD